MICSYNNNGFIIMGSLFFKSTKVTLLKAYIYMIEYTVHSAIFYNSEYK